MNPEDLCYLEAPAPPKNASGYPIDLLLYADDLEALGIGSEGRKGIPLSYLLL